MTSTNNPVGTGTQTPTKTFQASDIKSIIQGQGKATIGGKEFVLKHPASTDPKLQEIVKDTALSVKLIGSPAANGECEYELSANGKSVNIKVDCK